MRPLLAALAAVAVLALGASPVLAADEIVCGRLISLEPATATARGGLTIDQLQPAPPPLPSPSGGTVVPPGISFSLTPGTQLTYADLQGYFCVRFISSISPRTFLGLVAPGSPGYLPAPVSASPSASGSSAARPGGVGGTGTLPTTSTDASGQTIAMIAWLSALLMLGTAVALRRRRDT
jgi:MYXO-CTERM domain-containing protein